MSAMTMTAPAPPKPIAVPAKATELRAKSYVPVPVELLKRAIELLNQQILQQRQAMNANPKDRDAIIYLSDLEITKLKLEKCL